MRNNIEKNESRDKIKKDSNTNKDNFRGQSILRSFGVAISGILLVVKEERNIKIHILATILAIILGVVLNISIGEWCVVTIAIGIVMAGELINSAIETLVDVVMPNYDIRAKKVKDVSAGAVLILAISALIVGMLIFIPKLYQIYIR